MKHSTSLQRCFRVKRLSMLLKIECGCWLFAASLPSTSGTDSLHIYADPYAYEDPTSCTRDRVCEIEPAAITIESILLKGTLLMGRCGRVPWLNGWMNVWFDGLMVE